MVNFLCKPSTSSSPGWRRPPGLYTSLTRKSAEGLQLKKWIAYLQQQNMRMIVLVNEKDPFNTSAKPFLFIVLFHTWFPSANKIMECMENTIQTCLNRGVFFQLSLFDTKCVVLKVIQLHCVAVNSDSFELATHCNAILRQLNLPLGLTVRS